MQYRIFLLGLGLPMVLAVAGCEGDESTVASTSVSSSSASSSGSGTGGNGTGGEATGGEATGGAGGEGTGGAGGEATGGGGAGGQGGAAPSMVNGCDPSTAKDETASTSVTIKSVSSSSYDPKCIRIKAATSVTFESSFTKHPLVGGEYDTNGMKQPDPSSPIKPTSSGMSATFLFPSAGEFGYYCDIHSSMRGAIFVQ